MTMPHIIRMGGAEYAKIGTETSAGTKVVSVSGNVRKPGNYEVVLGTPSRGLIDVDLDHPLSVELAPQYLPPTKAIFGRSSKRRSHWEYRLTRESQTAKFQLN